MHALDKDKYHSLLVAFSTLRPGHHSKDPAVFDELNSHLTRGSSNKEIIALAEKYLPKPIANEFTTLVANIGANLPRLEEIRNDPLGARVPHDIHFQYVVGSAIAKAARADTVESYTKYLERLSPDIASMASHDIEKNDPALMTPELKALQLK